MLTGTEEAWGVAATSSAGVDEAAAVGAAEEDAALATLGQSVLAKARAFCWSSALHWERMAAAREV